MILQIEEMIHIIIVVLLINAEIDDQNIYTFFGNHYRILVRFCFDKRLY